jgi:hypothetical protein
MIHASAAGIDRVIQLGDFGIKTTFEAEAFLSALSITAEHTGVRLDFIDGNHDDHDELYRLRTDPSRQREDGSIEVRPGIHYWPRGTVIDLGGRRVGFLGGAVSVDRHHRISGETWWANEQITAEDVEQLVVNTNGKSLDVLLTHETIHGINIPSRYSDWPIDVEIDAREQRILVARAVEMTRPTLMMHGHWHTRYIAEYGQSTRVIGLGHESTSGMAILDLENLEVDDIGVPIPQLADIWANHRARH